MPPVNPALYLQARIDHRAASFRRILRPLLGDSGAGVESATALVVSERAAGANLTVDISPGVAVLPDGSSLPGYYLLTNEGTDNVALAPADPTNPRIDLVVFRVEDSVDNSPDLADESSFEVITGTPSATPVAPSLPANYLAIPLATVLVGAGVTSVLDADITDARSIIETVGSLSAAVAANALSIASNDSDIATNAATAAAAQSDATAALADAATAQAAANANTSSVNLLNTNTQHLSATGSQQRIDTDLIEIGVETPGGTVDFQAADAKNVRLVASDGTQGVGINSVGDAFVRPILTTSSPEFLRHSAGAGVYGIVSRQSSSRRWKKNIATSDTPSLSVVNALRVVTFESTLAADEGEGRQLGYIAEEVYEVDPSLVYLDEDELPAGVNHTRLSVLLLQAVQELTNEVEALKSRLEEQ